MNDVNSKTSNSIELSVHVLNAMGGLYDEYTNTLKPILAMVESFAQEFPGPVLNEIRAVNDHVSRCFIAGRSEAECLKELKKGRGHLIRAILDCYKALLIEYDKKINHFFYQYRDVCIAVVNDGKFLPELIRLYDNAKELAIKAKCTESKSFPEKEDAYIDYKEAILAFAEVDKYIKNNASGLVNATQFAKKQSKNNHKFSIYSALWGALFSAIVAILMKLFWGI